jgi:phenylacetate-coenzyme A ligase PaaK-like adenylate-forming protein
MAGKRPRHVWEADHAAASTALNTTATAKAIKAFRPDIVVCTHFLPTGLASLMMTRGVLDAKLAVVTTTTTSRDYG